MTLFKTTLAMLEEVEAALAALSVPAPGSGTALLVQAQVQFQANALQEIMSSAKKLKKGAEEADPEKRTYGPGMVQKILAFYTRYEAAQATVSQLMEGLAPEASVELEAQRAAEATAAAAAAAASRAQKEDEARVAAEAAAAVAKAQAQASAEEARVALVKAEEAAKTAAATVAKAPVCGVAPTNSEQACMTQPAQPRDERGAAAAAAPSNAGPSARDTDAAQAGPAPSSEDELREQAAKAAAALAAALSSAPSPAPTAQPETPPVAPAVSPAVAPPVAPAATSSSSVPTPTVASGSGGSRPGERVFGSVRHMFEGAQNLHEILEQAGPQLVVVNWTMAYCNPCGRMKPVVKELAAAHPAVCFVDADAMVSEENKDLAEALAVQGYPTFHFYRNRTRMHGFSGADEALLRSTLAKFLDPGAATSAPATSPSKEDLVAGVNRALQQLKASCSFDDFVQGARTLVTFVGNVVKDPSSAKYRKVRVANATFQDRLGRHKGGMESMLAFGFARTTEDNQEVLVMSETVARSHALVTVKMLLDSAAPKPPAPTNAPSAANDGPPLFPLMPSGLGAMGGMPDALGRSTMQETMRNIMQNPQRIQEMMNNPMVQQMIPPQLQDQMRLMLSNPQMIENMMNNPMVQQMMNNPASAEQMQQMAGNPQAMQQMMAGMGGGLGGLGGMGGVGGANGAAGGLANFLGNMNNFGGAPAAAGMGGVGMGATPSAGTGVVPQMSEDEMMAEAIRRSLEPGSGPGGDAPQPPPAPENQ